MEMPFGLVTPGLEPTTQDRWKQIKPLLPSLSGKTVLDIGAWDGFYSFEAEKMGARVFATDHFMWSGPGWATKAGFDFAHKALSSNVMSQDIDVPDISVGSVGRHDVVFFLNILYHLEDPYGCFQRICDVANEMILIETIVDEGSNPLIPYFRLAPDEILGDPTNWFIPNECAIHAMLEKFGFKATKVKKMTVGDPYIKENLSRRIMIAERKDATNTGRVSHMEVPPKQLHRASFL